MGETMSMSSRCRGQFSQMGSQRLLLLFKNDAHSRIITRPAYTRASTSRLSLLVGMFRVSGALHDKRVLWHVSTTRCPS